MIKPRGLPMMMFDNDDGDDKLKNNYVPKLQILFILWIRHNAK